MLESVGVKNSHFIVYYGARRFAHEYLVKTRPSQVIPNI